MKLKIRTPEFHFSIPVPTGLVGIVLRLTPNRLYEEARLKTPEPFRSLMTKETIGMLWEECHTILTEHRGLELVHVEAADGTFVSIKL